MFLSDVLKKEECRNEALKELRRLSIKCRPKKPKQQNVKTIAKGKVFNVPLKLLPTETVTLQTGQQIAIPRIVHQLCSFITSKAYTEGLFRKEGSRMRQNEIKMVLNGGGSLDKTNNVIDVASLLKTFLRELPEPIIPHTHHELFLRCVLLDQIFKTEALLFACLLLPIEHLNTLTYLLQFFYTISCYSLRNKMDPRNLSIVVGPALFRLEEKISPSNAQARTAKICEIIQILIESALDVGVLPESIIERLGQGSFTDMKKKKRRSGSLTRMFNGLKKIVGGKSMDESSHVVTPDLLLTPINNNVTKKRRLHNGISNKKKKELVHKLPDNALLNTPFTPCRTPISMDLDGTKENRFKDTNDLLKEKKTLWFSRSRSLKNLKQEAEVPKKIERRWSAINPSTNTRKATKRNSLVMPTTKEVEAPEPDYIRVSKTEYEAIKNRVTAMERKISIELDTVQSQISENDNNENAEVAIQKVQTAYEQTLQSNQLSPTTDQLARRLSRELKIRRSGEQKIIRSPSARKIGSMRRRSRELDNNKVARHKSWHAPIRGSLPRVSLKKGKPNVLTDLGVANSAEKKRTRYSAIESVKTVSCNLSGSSTDTWMSAEGFNFKSDSLECNGRSSLAKLRSQNAGMVLAKAKLFDKLSDSESSGSLKKSLPRAKAGTKIGSNRNLDARLSHRVRTLKYEERRVGRKSISPRKRNAHLAQKQKILLAKQYLNSSSDLNCSDKENIPGMDHLTRLKSPKYSTPRVPPHIKKSLNVRSPKRLCRTPAVERGTPLRALKTPL